MGESTDKALLFIADISGFTKFITQSEIEHSSHIISELLEVIINANNLNLKIAEIEGDAVFFYKITKQNMIEDVLKLCERMYSAFHKHLKLRESQKVCECGACMQTTDLSLKFVTHFGDVIVKEIHNRIQIMGKEVTLLHRLLKNNIENKEYLLLSESFENPSSFIKGSNCAFKVDSIYYEEFKDVSYKYCPLNYLDIK